MFESAVVAVLPLKKEWKWWQDIGLFQGNKIMMINYISNKDTQYRIT